MNYIDSHFHIGLNGIRLDNLESYLDENQLKSCWLMTWDEVSPQIPARYLNLGLEPILKARDVLGDRIVPMYAPDPRRNDSPDLLYKSLAEGVMGCAEMKFSLDWDSELLDDYLSVCNDYKLPLTFHMEEPNSFIIPSEDSILSRKMAEFMRPTRLRGLSSKMIKAASKLGFEKFIDSKVEEVDFFGYMLGFESLERRLRQFPDIKFIGHALLVWKGIDANWRSQKDSHPSSPILDEGITCKLLSKYENFFIDLSGMSGANALQRDPFFMSRFIDKFQDKVIFGTDNYFVNQKSLIEGLGLPHEVKEKIFYLNSENLITG